MNYKKSTDEPADHAIGRSRGGLTTKSHLVCDGKGRVLAFVVTGGQVASHLYVGHHAGADQRGRRPWAAPDTA